MSPQPIRLQYQTRKVLLPAGLAQDSPVSFVAATVFDDPPLPFAIVNYELAGQLQENGLRMDLDKRVFLDHFEDSAIQHALSESALRVAMAIGKARRGESTLSVGLGR